MASNPIPSQTINLFQFDDKVLPFTMSSVGDITGETYSFIVTTAANALVFSATSTGGEITITSAGSVSTYGSIEVDLTDLLEITPDTYKWELRRTNTGAEEVLAWGSFRVKQSRRDAA